MTIRDLTDLVVRLDEDLAPRRKETLFFKEQLIRSLPAARAAYLRGATAVLYAHWEGFVKTSFRCYYEYVHVRRPALNALNDGFAGIAMSRLASGFDDLDWNGRIERVREMRNAWERRAWLPQPDRLRALGVVDARSNLSSGALRVLFLQVGLPYPRFCELQGEKIDRLLFVRNTLAHGGWLRECEGYTLEEWTKELHPRVDALMNGIRDEIQLAAREKRYLAAPSGAR